MPYNGSGVFSLVAGNPVVTGTVISSTVQNNTMADIANNGLTLALTKDGQQIPTANIPLGGFQLTGVGNATTRDAAPNAGQIQDGGLQWLTAVAGTDTITASSASPSGMSAYVAGQSFRFIAAGNNTTGIPTLNINGIGAKNITRLGTQGVVPGDIISGSVVTVTYDGTQFQINGNVSASGVIGYSRNLNASLGAQGPTVTVTADEIILESALGFVPYKFASVSKTINISTTGLNGIDTGILPANGYCAVYWIYNPTTGVLGLLGTNATSAKQPEIYGGANAPSGFTISSLEGIWPAGTVNATFLPFLQTERHIDFSGSNIITGSVGIGGPSQTTSVAIPLNARFAGGNNQVGVTAASTVGQTITPTAVANAGGQANIFTCTSAQTVVLPWRCAINTPQSVFRQTTNSAGSPTFTVSINSYDF